MQDDILLVDEIDSPVGVLVLAANKGRLCALEFKDLGMIPNLQGLQQRFQRTLRVQDPFGFSSAVRQYLEGKFDVLDQVPVTLFGTEFQKKVWLTLREIPSGTTISYGELASRIGNPKSSRAVGITNGRNPIAIVLPCHRVIGANGKLTGYGGGLPRKEWLLQHEGALAPQLTVNTLVSRIPAATR